VTYKNDCEGSVTISWTLTDDSYGNDDKASMTYAITLTDASGNELARHDTLTVMEYSYTPEDEKLLGTEITVSVKASNSKRTSEAGTKTMIIVTTPG